MDKETINKISGRLLDAAVAEHVFEWRDIVCMPGTPHACPILRPPLTVHTTRCAVEMIGCRAVSTLLPRYTTDLNAAWMALEKVAGHKHRSYKIDTHDGTGAEECGTWCIIKRGNHEVIAEGMGGINTHDDDDYKEEGNQMAIAICRAVLLAVFADK